MTPQTQEALKMAIEALEQAKEQLGKYWDEDINRGYDIEEMDDSPILLCGDTINVCKEALEAKQETWQAAECYKIYAKNKDVCNFKSTSVKKGDMVYIKPPILNRLSDADIFEELERTDTFTAKSFFAGVRWAEEEFARINGMELSDE
jgi:molybdopterin converting factor small subunit